MTFAALRALYTIIGEALDDIEQVYHTRRPETAASDVEELYGDYDFEPTARGSQPSGHSDHRRSRKVHKSTRSAGSANAISKAYVSPPPSPCVATYDHSRPPTVASELLDFPSLDAPCDPTSPAETLTVDPKVTAAINRIIAACGQLTATVQTPFLTICDSTMGYHLPSCMRVVEAAHVVEILRAGGSDGLHVDLISERCGVESSKLAHVLRLLATHHIFRETSPNVFATNRISSLIDSGKSLQELYEYRSAGKPELKYQGTNGIAAFVGLCSDEINKSSAYMTETYLLSTSSKVRRANEPTLAPFCFAFETAHLGVDYFGWLEGAHDKSADDRYDPSSHFQGPRHSPALRPSNSSAALNSGANHNRTQSSASLPTSNHKNFNPNRFRLERFGKAMSGTGSWEAPGAVFNAFDWRSLPRGSVVVDVGGGIGSTSMLLATAFSSSEGEDLGLKFIIQDRSVVVEMGEKAWREKCPDLLHSGLATFQVHDFFTPQPVRNASVFLLRVVLHDWPDEYARKILVQLREAANPDTKLLLADFVLPLACAETMSSDSGLEGIEGTQTVLPPAPLLPNLGKASANVYWMDMTMNAMFNSQERTLREIVALTRSAGWKVVRVTQAPGSLFGHIIAVPIAVSGPRQRNRSRKESITAILSSLHTKKRASLSNPSEDPDTGVTRIPPLRCNTPTFGSSTEVSTVKEALARFGGGVKRYSRGSGKIARALGASSASSSSFNKPLPKEPSERSAKKRPSPLAVFPATSASTGIEIVSPSPPPPAKQEGGFRQTIRRHVSLASLSRRAPSEPEPTPAMPPIPQQLPTPVTPTYSTLPTEQPRLMRHSSHTHLRHNRNSSNMSTPSSIPLPSSPDLIPQTSHHYHRSSNSSSSFVHILPPKPRTRSVSTIQLSRPQTATETSSSREFATGAQSPTGEPPAVPRKPRISLLRFDRPKRFEEGQSFSPEISPRGSGGKMSSVLAVAARGLNLRRSQQS